MCVSYLGCSSLLAAVAGCSLKLKNVTAVSNYLRLEPAGTSVKNIVHWAQEVKRDVFQKFDYEDPQKNIDHYKRPTPPPYDLSQIQLPNSTVFFAGGWDALADPTDVNHLILLMQVRPCQLTQSALSTPLSLSPLLHKIAIRRLIFLSLTILSPIFDE